MVFYNNISLHTSILETQFTVDWQTIQLRHTSCNLLNSAAKKCVTLPFSFIQTISIAPLQVHFYSEALPTRHGYCAGVSRRSAIYQHFWCYIYTRVFVQRK